MLPVLPPGLAARSLPVVVSILPQKYFVQQIGGQQVQVTVMVQPGANPATYEPSPRQMVQLSRACLYFAIGVPFETVWLKKIAAANPDMKIIHTDHNIRKIPMKTHLAMDTTEDQFSAQTGQVPAGKGTETGIPDPHIWLSPPLVKPQARCILDALVQIDPSRQEFYITHFERFMTALDELSSILGLFCADVWTGTDTDRNGGETS
jgi:zinc transport system substrate-binding protein